MTQFAISHVVYGARDLRPTVEGLRRGLGLRAIRGSDFPNLGLADWLVPFEDQYIELLAVADDDLAGRTPFGRWIAESTAGSDRLLAWALDVDDDALEAAAERLGLPPEPLDFIDSAGEPRRPRLVGAARAFAEPCFPFFIAWDDAARVRRALSETSASVHHERGARGIAWVEVAGDRDAIGEWIGDLGPQVRVAPGEPALRAIGIATDDGEAVLETAA